MFIEFQQMMLKMAQLGVSQWEVVMADGRHEACYFIMVVTLELDRIKKLRNNAMCYLRGGKKTKGEMEAMMRHDLE